MQGIKTSLSALITALEDIKDKLVTEQENSEAALDDWENSEDEEKGDEPELADNQSEIDRLSRASNFLEKAVDELDD